MSLCVIGDIVDAYVHSVVDLRRYIFAHRRLSVIERCLRHFRLSGGVGGNNPAVVVELDSVGSNLRTFLARDPMGNSLLGFHLSSFPSELFKVVKVASLDWGNVFATENSHFKVLRPIETALLRDLSASAFEVV